ncbi:MAG: 30S ribosomal protein S9 [bacterium]|nr:30S ribosomal protein S9 [bacterium]
MASAKKYYYAVGRRKLATAVIKLFPQGSGQFTIQKGDAMVSFDEYFGGHEYLKENILFPFSIIGDNTVKKYDAEIKTHGGGLMGQADAIRLAFSRALIQAKEEWRLTLKPHSLLKRDPRIKERKKPGLKKARKAPQWSKR